LFRAFHSLISVQNSGHLLIIIITIITDENWITRYGNDKFNYGYGKLG
jgi:hypothetical protein